MDVQSLASSALAATIAALVLNRAIEWKKSNAVGRAQLRGILLELAHAEHCAARFLDKSTASYAKPVYRIATQFLGSSIEALVTSGALKQNEAERLHRFFIEADETNKALDAIANLSDPPSMHGLEGVIASMRNSAVCRGATDRFTQLLQDLPEARATVEAALSRLAWFEPQD